MANSLALLAKVGIIRIPDWMWEKIHPHVPKVTQEFTEFMAAGAVRDVAKRVSDKKVRTQLLKLSEEMAAYATKGMLAGWEDGDICPPWPFPWPGPRPPFWDDIFEQFGKDAPVIFRSKATEQILLADMLLGLSEVTTNTDFHKSMVHASIGIARSIGSLADDFERCGTVPRVPKGVGGPRG
jgi:hypothetical protein